MRKKKLEIEKKAMIRVENLSRVFKVSSSEVRALKGVSFEIYEGEFTVILGPSGSGKTTLLNLLGGMDKPTDGEIYVDEKPIANLSKKERCDYRRYDVGFVFQFYNLMPNLTALENVELASELSKDALPADESLKKVGLGERIRSFPGQLSGGEQQRVSIARALAKNAKLLLCDEPTGALDYRTGKAILKLLFDTAHKEGKTVVVVTHNSAIAPMADSVIHIRSGSIQSVERNPSPTPIKDIEW